MEDLKKPAPAKRSVVSIRKMEIDDLPAVFHLGERVFTAKTVPNLYRTWDEHEVVELFDTDREYCLVAESNDLLVGFTLGTTVEKSRSAWKYGLLIWLGVDPEYQARGVGRRLFNHFRDLMTRDGARILLVDTEADNTQALRFFKKLGFGKPEPHVYLSLNLAPHKRSNGESDLKNTHERKKSNH